ncbi:MAG TPA: phosphoenolpyruvate hydrolase family protein [Planctomycetota bacterium]|nr:phosphoenolpyruvate hydrolase family protein [Planctomycetota bacterium]
MPTAFSALRHRRRESGNPLIAVVAGNGQVTRCAVDAKADLLLAFSAGPFRHLGVGSLASFFAYDNANDTTRALIERELLPRAGEVPVIAGVCGHDPTIDLDALLAHYVAIGVTGVVNWPAVGFVDGTLRQAMEAEGCGEASELAMLEKARAHGLATIGFVLDRDAATRFAVAGCDALVLDLGLTRRWADIRDHRDQLSQAIADLNGMTTAVRASGHDPLCLLFGGPVVDAEDFAEVLRHVAIDGFAGGSVFERLPVQDVVAGTIARFKQVAAHAQHDAALNDDLGLEGIVGRTPPMRRLFELIHRVAPTDLSVCIEGESGSGKELVAAAIHRLSARAHQPFVTLNCGALPDTLVESELFGHEKGAFTGADRRRLGKFELAHGGTLFLDEIADLSTHGQVALLRALQSREITRLGGDRAIPVDLRVVVASHQVLTDAVATGRFRADLYYRLNHLTLRVPPLRERTADIPLLVEHLLPRLSAQLGRVVSGANPAFLHRLAQHPWPGNVRELHHVVTRTALMEDGAVIAGHALALEEPRRAPNSRPDSTADRRQRARTAIEQARGNKSDAARTLGITRKTLYAWLNG